MSGFLATSLHVAAIDAFDMPDISHTSAASCTVHDLFELLMHMKKYVTLIAALSATCALGQPIACQNGDQPYDGRCVSKAVSDYLACVKGAGGNVTYLRNVAKDGNSSSGQGGVSAGSGRGGLAGQVSAGGSGTSAKDALRDVSIEYGKDGLSQCGMMLKLIQEQQAIRSEIPTDNARNGGVKLSLPIERTTSSQKVTFFPGFVISIHSITGLSNGPLKVEVETSEDGLVWMETGRRPVNVTHKGITYTLAARVRDDSNVVLILDRQR